MLGSSKMLAELRFSSYSNVIYPANAMLNPFLRGFCNTNESTELPAWVKFPQDSSVGNFDDDFVLPVNEKGFASWVDSLSVASNEIGVRLVSGGSVETDAEKISRVLKTGFGLPESVFRALDACKVDVSDGLVEKILKRFNNDWISAFDFFGWAGKQMGYKHLPESYDGMIDILGKFKQFDKMWVLVDEMARLGWLVSLVTVSKIMRRLAGAGRWKEAIEVFQGIERFGLKKDTMTMNVILDTLSKERSSEHARDLFLELRSKIPPNAHTFNILTHGSCKARRLDEARLTMEEMRRYGFNPCVVSYTSLIEAYCAEKNFRIVYSLLDEMQDRGCPPNVVTYTIVMHSLGKAKQTQEALDIYEKMKRNGCDPDTSFYNSLIYIIGKAGRLRDAHELFEEMCKSGTSPNVTTFNTMIATACEHSQEEKAVEILRDMEERSCKPDLGTYSDLLKMCCKRKRVKTLYYLLNDMHRKDISPDLGTYSLLVHGLCRANILDRACLFFEEMVLKGLIPKDHTYNKLMKELERKGKGKAKERIQQLMVQAQSAKQHDCHQRVHAEVHS